MSGILRSAAEKAVKAGTGAAGRYASKKASELKHKAAVSVAQRALLEKRPGDGEFADRIQALQRHSLGLEKGVAKMDREIDGYERELASTFPLNFSKKAELRNDIEFALLWEYAIREYLSLLLELEESPRKLNREERRFFNTCGDYVNKLAEGAHVGKFVSEIVFSRNSSDYVKSKYSWEIARRKRCDMSGVLTQLREYGRETHETSLQAKLSKALDRLVR